MTLHDNIIMDYEKVDDFLSNGFLVHELPFGTESNRCPAIIDRVSFLANSLLQAIKIPVFEQARIVEVQHNQDQASHRIRLLAPTLVNVPQEVILQAHGFALKILTGLHPDYDLDAAFTSIDENFVKKFKGLIPGGLSTVSVAHAAFKHRVPVMHLGSGIYQLGWGEKARWFDRSTNDKDTALGNKVASDKRLTNLILRQAGFPLPRQKSVSSLEAALKAGKEIGYPVVLKPALLERGEGVSIDLFSEKELQQAYLDKQEAFDNLVVEQQVSGVCHRIFVAGQRVRHVVARHPMHVVGDGINTIRDLSRIENEAQGKLAKHRRRPRLEINETSSSLFSELGLDADSVPPEGLRVPFQRVESTEFGGIAEDLTNDTHPDNIMLAKQVADFCGLDVLGLDIITEDISTAWHKNGAKINEINFSPLLSPYRDWVQKGLNEYVQEIFPQQGRIPIRVFIGGEQALSDARHHQAELFKIGQPHFLCSRDVTLKPNGTPELSELGNSLFLRGHALLLNKTVEGVIFVLQDDSILTTGFPFDGASHKEMVDDQFISSASGELLEEIVRTQIMTMIDQLPLFKIAD